MKNCFKTLFILLALAFASEQVMAQKGTDDWSWSTYKYNGKYPGYVETHTGEKIEGYIQLRGQVENQEKVLFFANEADKKPTMKYGPDDIKAYMVADKYYTSAPYGNILSPKKKNFILVLSEGRIHRLKHYFIDNEKRTMESTELLQKGDEKPTGQAKFIMFAKNFGEYINDYPELSAKVTNKEKGYGLIQMDSIIDEYNKWWEENNK